eukprot:10705374-Karenia_brevis.AAC.1
MFNLEVALGQVDKELSYLVRDIIRRDDIQRFPDSWDPKEDHLVDRVLYDKYSSELYGVLVTLTTAEPLSIIQGLVDTVFKMDGFKAVIFLNQRLDVRNSASLLSSFLKVMSPTNWKGSKDVVAGIQEWERK